MYEKPGINGWLRAAGAVLALCAGLSPLCAAAADPEHGRMLHDMHCVSCHDSKIYKRESKVAFDYESIRSQVVRWQKNVALNWNDSDIDAVTTYLARTFYKVPCPVC
jgi:mono/diheme cytochrome c family protein